jgi:hypothetical protein
MRSDPAEYCVVAPDTEIFCEREPVKREDLIKKLRNTKKEIKLLVSHYCLI